MFEFGKIILVPFPFTDLTSAKIRPALILSKSTKNSDIIVSFISSKTTRSSNTFALKTTDTCFVESGLKVDSEIRLDKIATLNKAVVLGELGSLNTKTLAKINPVFHKVFGF